MSNNLYYYKTSLDAMFSTATLSVAVLALAVLTAANPATLQNLYQASSGPVHDGGHGAGDSAANGGPGSIRDIGSSEIFASNSDGIGIAQNAASNSASATDGSFTGFGHVFPSSATDAEDSAGSANVASDTVGAGSDFSFESGTRIGSDFGRPLSGIPSLQSGVSSEQSSALSGFDIIGVPSSQSSNRGTIEIKGSLPGSRLLVENALNNEDFSGLTVTLVQTIDIYTTITNVIYNSVPVTLTEFLKTTLFVPTREVVSTAVDDRVFVATAPVTRTGTITVTDTLTSYQCATEVSTDLYTVTHRAYDIRQQVVTSTVVQTQVFRPTIVSTLITTELEAATVVQTVTNTVFVEPRVLQTIGGNQLGQGRGIGAAQGVGQGFGFGQQQFGQLGPQGFSTGRRQQLRHQQGKGREDASRQFGQQGRSFETERFEELQGFGAGQERGFGDARQQFGHQQGQGFENYQ